MIDLPQKPVFRIDMKTGENAEAIRDGIKRVVKSLNEGY